MLNKICFLHVHKCAGSSIIKLARSSGRKLYSVEENGNPRFAGGAAFSVSSGSVHSYEEVHFPSRIQFWKWPDEQQSEFYSTMSADFVAIEAPLVCGLYKHSQLKYFTVLRDPIARSVSHYYQRLEDGIGQLSMEAYFDKKLPGTDNFITRYFSGNERDQLTPQDYERALAVLTQVNAVLFLDRLEGGLSELNALGWSFMDSSLPKSGSIFSASRPKLMDELMPLAMEFNKWDIQLWNAVRNQTFTAKHPPQSRQAMTGGEDFERALQQNLEIGGDRPDADECEIGWEAHYFDQLNWAELQMNPDHLLFLLKRALHEGESKHGIQLLKAHANLEGVRAVHFYYLRLLANKLECDEFVLKIFQDQLHRFMGSASFLRDYEAVAACCGNLELALEANHYRSSLFVHEDLGVEIDRYWLLCRLGDCVSACKQSEHLVTIDPNWQHGERVYDLVELALSQGAHEEALQLNRSIIVGRGPVLDRQLFWIYYRLEDCVSACKQSEHLVSIDPNWEHGERVYDLVELLFSRDLFKEALEMNEHVTRQRSLSLDRQKYYILCELNDYARAFELYDDLSGYDTEWSRVAEIKRMAQIVSARADAWSHLEALVLEPNRSETMNLFLSLSCASIGKSRFAMDAFRRGVGCAQGTNARLRLRRELSCRFKESRHYRYAILMWFCR
jgi:hypothetical protein